MFKGYRNILFYKDKTNKNIAQHPQVSKCSRCNNLNLIVKTIATNNTNNTNNIQICSYCGNPFYTFSKKS